MTNKLNYWKAYKVMFCFLDEYWKLNQINDLALLLGTMNPSIFKGDHPVDDQVFLDWIGIIKRDNILNEEVDIEECFLCMVLFLKQEQVYYSINIQRLIDDLELIENDKGTNADLWTLWIDCFLKG
ncbi:MAG: hypothetical protein JWO09_2736 [Bacteroidetes bacterium]|nr:hypothetical protein [Bacteroidota bacterium]